MLGRRISQYCSKSLRRQSYRYTTYPQHVVVARTFSTIKYNENIPRNSMFDGKVFIKSSCEETKQENMQQDASNITDSVLDETDSDYGLLNNAEASPSYDEIVSNGMVAQFFEKFIVPFNTVYDYSGSVWLALAAQFFPLLGLNIFLKILHGCVIKKKLDVYGNIVDSAAKLEEKARQSKLVTSPSKDELKYLCNNAYKLPICETVVIFVRAFPFWTIRSSLTFLDYKKFDNVSFLWVNNILDYDPYGVLPLIYVLSLSALLYRNLSKKWIVFPLGVFFYGLLMSQSTLFTSFVILHTLQIQLINFCTQQKFVSDRIGINLPKAEKDYIDLKKKASSIYSEIKKINREKTQAIGLEKYNLNKRKFTKISN